MWSRKIILSVFFVSLGTVAFYGQYTPEDWERRDRWMDVSRILDLANIKMGNQVGDVGCHEGYLTFHLSQRVGNAGKVYAVDISSYRLERLQDHLQKRKIENVQVIQGETHDPKLPENLLDAVIIMDTYHEMKAYMEVLAHVRKALKPNGRILILEKLKEHVRTSNRKTQTDAHTIAAKYVRNELEEAGFEILEEISEFGYWKEDRKKPIWILVGVPNAL